VGDDEQYTQHNRLLSIDTPLGKDVLLLQGLAGHEGVSSLFTYELELLAPNNDCISFKDIVGQNVSIVIQLPDGTPRHINGYVSRFAQAGTDKRYFTHYHAQVVPWLWFLTRQADCRIFQNMTVPDIISQVFSLFSFAKFKQSLTGTYPTLEYCVQYRETAFNFVSRLMEEYGIFYYFDHSTQGQHTLVLKDSSNGLQPCPSSPASYQTVVGGLDDPEVVSDWHVEQELETGKYSVTDYNFTTPSTSLLANEPTVVSVSPNQDLEVFDYPGLYTTLDQGTTVARVRMQEQEAHCLVASGSSNCRGFMSGYTFQLQNHYRADQNTTYVLTEVQHAASEGGTYITGTREGEYYSNHVTCIPSSIACRPARVTRKPFVQGPQPALVVGKAGEEIWVDQYGRVKVQFYWDRLGQKNENSSCWIRVSQPWAGKNWGAIFIPRIGQEVIVSFLEGDPDRPIITGRVYNAEQMPPGTLPDHQTASGIRTRSTKGGGEHDANVLAFNDTKGQEVFYVRAQKDMYRRVENNDDLRVGSNQTENIGSNRTVTIGKSDAEKVGMDQSITIGTSQTVKVGTSQTSQIGTSQDNTIGLSQSNTIGTSQDNVIGTSQTSTIGATRTTTVAASESHTIGGMLTLTAGGVINVTAGGATMVTSGGPLMITAPVVLINGVLMVTQPIISATAVVSPAYTPGLGNLL
jgi:type VI secretion system secreted protein VgrG